MDELILVLCNDAVMRPNDIVKICPTEKWVPVMAYRPKDQPDHPPIIIAFRSQEMAYRFTKRNVSNSNQKEGWLRGAVLIRRNTINWIKAQGWHIDVKDWPQLMVNNQKWDIAIEIVNLQEDVEVHVLRSGLK